MAAKSKERTNPNDLTAPASGRVPAPSFIIGLLLLCVGALATLGLVLEHFGAASLPGCGLGGGCARAAASAWGRVPGLKWPVSFVGLAYFTAVLAAWFTQRRALTDAFVNLIRLGGAVSLCYLLVIVVGRYSCHYCQAAHVANLAFCGLVEWLRPKTKAGVGGLVRRGHALVMTAAAFALVSAALAIGEHRHQKSVARRAEAAYAESTAKIVAATTQKATAPTSPALANGTPIAPQSVPTTAPSAAARNAGFTGRWRLGPERAPIRLVIISDYQCIDCQRIEAEVRKLVAGRSDISLSAKHFPMCTDCNAKYVSVNLHQNACWAARAAETAGLLRGNDGFWQMHYWLFDRKGFFTKADLEVGLRELNYDDAAEFERILQGDEPLRRVQADAAEAADLGLHYTPMIFINGVELRGWTVPNAVTRAVESVAAQHPPALSPEVDHPPPASEKFIADWRAQPPQQLPAPRYARGPAKGRVTVRVTMWGDFREANTVAVDQLVSAWVAAHGDCQYDFHHFPFEQSCNAKVSASPHATACRASQAALAAGVLGGPDAYWAMHDWLMRNQQRFDDAALHEAAAVVGIEDDVLLQTMAQPAVSDAMTADVNAASAFNIQSIPMVFVNGKFVPRWQREGDRVLERIMEEARGR